MKIKTYDIKAKITGEEKLLDLKKKPGINLIYIINRINSLNNIKPVQTKTRGERRGGGIKPWKQKGTGRARVGSNRSPIWRKGGITFGPRKEKNFKRVISKKSIKIAKNYLLSEKINKGEVIIWELDPKTAPIKTKEAEKILLKLPVQKGRILLLINEKESFPGLYNIAYLDIKNVNSISVLDPLQYNLIIFTPSAFKSMNGIGENPSRQRAISLGLAEPRRSRGKEKDAKSKN
jgi:large subunit ribosomal protein L4